jgi:choline dehydrogenase-like flavoprotein
MVYPGHPEFRLPWFLQVRIFRPLPLAPSPILTWIPPRTIDSCKDIGLPFVDDINSPKQPSIGCGSLHFTRDQNQYRHSTYHAFLPKDLALSRQQNLHIATNTVVEKLQIEKNSNDGKLVARGIDLVSRSGKEKKSVGAKKEIILCAGVFGSPHILMLSGIGPADHLKEHDIEVVKNLPAIGSNLVKILLFLMLGTPILNKP